jgi:hypothetical protein
MGVIEEHGRFIAYPAGPASRNRSAESMAASAAASISTRVPWNHTPA